MASRCRQLGPLMMATSHPRLRQRFRAEAVGLRWRLMTLRAMARDWGCQGGLDPLSADLLQDLCRRGLEPI